MISERAGSPEADKSATQSAYGWSTLDSLGVQILRFGFGILLARFLFPKDFGLIAATAIVLAVASSLIQSGLSQSLIQTKVERPAAEWNTVFAADLLLALALFAIVWSLAPLAAQFYGEPQVTVIIRSLSLTFPLLPFIVIQQARYTRQLDFKSIAVANMAGVLAGGTAAIFLALNGFGVWSLVAQFLLDPIIRMSSLWWRANWQPTLDYDWPTLRERMQYALPMMGSASLNAAFSNLYFVAIGRFDGPTQLGFYSRGVYLQQAPSSGLSGAVASVLFPRLAAVQNDRASLRDGMRGALRGLLFVLAPAMIGLAAVAEPLITTLMTDKWLPAVPILQIAVLLGLLHPLHVVNLTLLRALGRTDLFFRLEIVKQALAVVIIICTVPFGIVAVVSGQVLASVISIVLNTHYAANLADYPLRGQLRDVFPYLLLCLPMISVVWAIDAIELAPAPDLLTKVFVGAVVYFSIARITGLAVWVTWTASLPEMNSAVRITKSKERN